LDFLSLKNDVNAPSKTNRQKNLVKTFLYVGFFKVNDENSRIRIQDPDPVVRGLDPRIRIRIRIHIKMSWIRNTSSRVNQQVRSSECPLDCGPELMGPPEIFNIRSPEPDSSGKKILLSAGQAGKNNKNSPLRDSM
jgi:hypothetical protein